MARSRRITPITSFTTSDSDKLAKRKANRAERRAVRAALVGGRDDDMLPARREISDPWNFPKDGKAWFGFGELALMRK
jgi:hypothetical protein